MTENGDHVHDDRMRVAIDELRALLLSRYPDATFTVGSGEDPAGVYLYATVDVVDRLEVIDLFIDRLVELQIDEGLPLYVIPLRPAARNEAILRARREHPWPKTSLAS